MIPAGYLLKRVQPPPGWLAVPHVAEVCSVSDCVNDNVVDVASAWAHNGFGVAQHPDTLFQLCEAGKVDAAEARLFYYEAYEQEMAYDSDLVWAGKWQPLSPVPSGTVVEAPVIAPARARLLGFDVVVGEDYLEHSPLSCNSMAEKLTVNAHCLFDTLDQAKTAVEGGAFQGCEPGVYRIYAVYEVDEV